MFCKLKVQIAHRPSQIAESFHLRLSVAEYLKIVRVSDHLISVILQGNGYGCLQKQLRMMKAIEQQRFTYSDLLISTLSCRKSHIFIITRLLYQS